MAEADRLNRIRLERASQKQSSDTLETPYDLVKLCWERKINIKASEHVNVDLVCSWREFDASVWTVEAVSSAHAHVETSHFLTNSPRFRFKLRRHSFRGPERSLRAGQGEYGAAPECKGGQIGRFSRKLADQRYRPARFSRAKIRDRPRRESNPIRLGGESSRMTTKSPLTGRRTRGPFAAERKVLDCVSPPLRGLCNGIRDIWFLCFSESSSNLSHLLPLHPTPPPRQCQPLAPPRATPPPALQKPHPPPHLMHFFPRSVQDNWRSRGVRSRGMGQALKAVLPFPFRPFLIYGPQSTRFAKTRGGSGRIAVEGVGVGNARFDYRCSRPRNGNINRALLTIGDDVVWRRFREGVHDLGRDGLSSAKAWSSRIHVGATTPDVARESSHGIALRTEAGDLARTNGRDGGVKRLEGMVYRVDGSSYLRGVLYPAKYVRRAKARPQTIFIYFFLRLVPLRTRLLLKHSAAQLPRWLNGYRARLPPKRTGLNPRPGHSLSFACRNRARRGLWSTGFLGILPFLPPVSPSPSFRRGSIFTSITLIGCQYPAVKSRPNLFTLSLTLLSKHIFTYVRHRNHPMQRPPKQPEVPLTRPQRDTPGFVQSPEGCHPPTGRQVI
ncbi:hypothetical protein PR048_023045 [Dryococelus australis]|uniref:Uncharacterized protein n=1 Tax=Dryococelus australis TaxID=614101 RepID=A0ABQ9GT11_9NEOP|nr:hypothetical protein PR048_023045 [Dryococelus australis]